MPRKRSKQSTRDGDEQVRAAMDALRRIVRALRLAAVEVERDLGITVAQLFLLQQLADGHARSINELADGTVTDPSTVSGLVRRLIERKLVRRAVSARDARRAEVSLTNNGAALLARAPKAPQDELVAALSAMPERQRRPLSAGLVQLAQRLGPSKPSLFFEEDAAPRRRR